MARNEIFIHAVPEEVYELLCEPLTFLHCMPGAHEITASDPDWPSVGTRFDHAVGNRLFSVRGYTAVIAEQDPGRLELRAGAVALPPAHLLHELQPEAGG